MTCMCVFKTSFSGRYELGRSLHHRIKLEKEWYEGSSITERGEMKTIWRIKCFDSLQYEPYVVIPCVPRRNLLTPDLRPRVMMKDFMDMAKTKSNTFRTWDLGGFPSLLYRNHLSCTIRILSQVSNRFGITERRTHCITQWTSYTQDTLRNWPISILT